MNFLPFQIFRAVTGGHLDPLLHPFLNCDELLLEKCRQGEELVVYYEITFFRKGDAIFYHSHQKFYFQDYPKISEADNWKTPKYSSKALKLINSMPPENVTISRLVTTYQIHPYKVVVGIREPMEEMSNYDKRFHYYNLLFKMESDLIKRSLYENVHHCRKEKAKKKFVRNIQSLIEKHYEKASEVVSENGSHLHISTEQSVAGIFKLQLQYLDGLRLHIYDDYNDYIHPNLKVPFFIRQRFMIEHAKEMECARKFAHSPMEDDFKAVLNDVLNRIDSLESNVTYAILDKFRKVLIETGVILKAPNVIDNVLVDRLVTIFESLSINTPTFTFYMCRHIESAVSKLSTTDVMDFLSQRIQHYSELKQQQSHEVIDFTHVDTMLNFCKMQLTNCKEALELGKSIDHKPAEKYIFTGSVAELGALIRVLKECGMIELQNVKDFVNSLCYSLSTIGADSISPRSLYNKYVTVDKKAAENLHHDFIKAIKVLNEIKTK